MNPIHEFIASGLLELYVMGAASPEDSQEVEAMAAAHPEVRQELDQLQQSLQQYAQAHAVKPRSTVKTLLMATIDYMERMASGELPSSPPIITPDTQIRDFEPWLSREDAVLPANAEGIYAKIIGYTPKATTAIIWVKEMTEPEVHHDEYERFLIVEGTCTITAGETMRDLKAGDFFAVPLHTNHLFKVTSDIPCKAILQRLSLEQEEVF